MANYVTNNEERDLIIKLLRIAKYACIEFHLNDMADKINKLLDPMLTPASIDNNSLNGHAAPANCEVCDD